MNSFTREVSVIIPTLNEASNIRELIKRVVKSLSAENFRFEIIFIDDNSTDNTINVIENEIKKLPIELKGRENKGATFKLSQRPILVKLKKGEKGKAFSIFEGFEIAKYGNIAIIDADLQYPPEAIAEMCLKLNEADVVVGNREYKKASNLRRGMSRVFRSLVGKLLFNIDHDIQSGLKVFKREVLENLNFTPVSGWTFDLEFIYRAKELGFKIAGHNILFTKRKGGKSKVNVIKTTFEIFLNALQVRLHKIEPNYIKPQTRNTMLGAGIRHKKKLFVTHSTLTQLSSAYKTAVFEQKMFIFTLLYLLTAGLVINVGFTLVLVVAILSTIYFVDTVFNCYLILRSLNQPQEITFTEKELNSLSNKSLPIYTILCPLYKEAHMIPQFIEAIEKISWPKEKLDAILLLEEDDTESIELVRTHSLPIFVRTIIVPHSIPKTKPKACNYGLSMAKGEYLVIYDAEDIPDPMQLKKAYIGFQKANKNILCLQAKLNYHNPHQNLLTRLFTAEYSLWFDVMLTGYQSLNTTIPLGGTSNHFRTKTLLELRGWDSFNVTEDADLGVRLFKKGFRTAIIDSTTLEEANSDLKNWIRQRSRWIKGYMQTYLVHTRGQIKFFKNSGHHAFLFNLILGGKIMFILINPFLWVATLSYFTLNQYVGPTIEKLYPTPVFYMAATSLVFGNFLYIFYYMIGCIKREQYSLVKYVFLVPFYWIFISFAGFISLYQLIFKPFYWEKTLHGSALNTPKRVRFAFFPRVGALNFNFRVPRVLVGDENAFSLILKNIKFNFNDLLYLFKNNIKSTDDDQFSILIFNWRDTKHKWAGGAEGYIQELAKGWVEQGNNVTIFSSNDHYSKRFEVVEGVNIVRAGGSYTVYFWAFLYYLFKFKNRTDVIVDSENGIPFFTPLYAFKPIILLIHHVHQEIFMSELMFPFSYIARFAEGKMMPLLYRNRTIVTVSESSKEAITRLRISKADDIRIVKPGIPSDFLTFEKFKTPTFIYLGRLKPYKNIDIAIKAFDEVQKFARNAKLLIVGDGESREKLEALVENLNLKEKVVFYGKVEERLKYELLGKSWIALQPSKIEGWGLTVIEANAAGTPVIATDTDGLRDSIVANKTGILVKHKDIQGFANNMLSLIRSKKKRYKMSQNAYIWSSNFSWDQSSTEFLRILTGQNYKEANIFGYKYITNFVNRITSLF